MRMSKEIIGTVSYMGGLPSLLEEFCWSWSQMIQYNSEYLCGPNQEIFYTRVKASFHSWARNKLAEECLGDWIFMLDTDHTFDPDVLARLLIQMNRHKVDVISAIYETRHEPHAPVAFKWKGTGFGQIRKWQLEEDERLLRVDSVGCGTILIKRTVFDRVRDELGQQPFDVIHPWGEDHSFFRRLMRLGIKVYVDPKIESHHLVTRGLSLSDYEQPA